MNKAEKSIAVPIWERVNLTLEEASAYTGIGINRLRELADDPDCEFVLWVGNRRLLKREKLKKYLAEVYSV